MNPVDALRIAIRTAALMRSQWWSEAKIDAYQDGRLAEMLHYACTNVPYYRDLGIDRGEVSARDWLGRFPWLTKRTVQECADSLRCPRLAGQGVHRSRTSGTTGEPITTIFDHASWLACKYATKARRVLNAGGGLAPRILVVCERSDAPDGRPSPPRRLPLVGAGFGRLFLDDPLAKNLRLLAEYRPTMLYGQPSYLEHLCEAASSYAVTLPRVPVIFTSSELLTDTLRERLESRFRGRVTDIYGSTEFKEIAVQCADGRYHLNFESVYVESVFDPAIGLSRLVVTSLLNRAMPLIRFDIGDFGSVRTGGCECGRSSPWLADIRGRQAELLRFECGATIPPFVLTTLVGGFEEIRNYTIRHESPTELTLRIFADPPLSAERTALLIQKVSRVLPADVALTIRPLRDRLPPGKRMTVQCDFSAQG